MIRQGLLLCLTFGLSSCIVFQSKPSTSDSLPPPGSSIDSSGEELPFTMKILEEVNDGKELHILGTVSAKARWDARNVVVRLASLKGGTIGGVSYFSLADLARKVDPARTSFDINEGDQVTFSLAVPSKDITDYQLELLWGKEALSYLKESTPPKNLNVKIQNIRVETLRRECGYDVCELRFRLLGDLLNTGEGIVNQVKLGVGIVAVTGSDGRIDLSGEVPENEQKVEIKGIRLLPGDSKAFRLLLDRGIPEDESSGYKPVLRIISFDGE